MTTTSLPGQSSWTVMPAWRHRAIICSVFTRFLSQPRDMNDTFMLCFL